MSVHIFCGEKKNVYLNTSLIWGWLGVAKVSCILCHRGDHLILAYSWARPAILADKGRGGNVFISSVSSFLFFFLLCPSLSSPLLFFLSLSPLSQGDHTT